MSKVQTGAGAAAATMFAYFLRRSSLDLVGIVRITNDDVTPLKAAFANLWVYQEGFPKR
jgi:hypothetical protein